MSNYIPKSFPEKCALFGGGQFVNRAMIVNVLSVKETQHPMIGHENETVLEATCEERGQDGIRIFEPYLLSYWLSPLPNELKGVPLDTYTMNGNGKSTGEHTGAVIENGEWRI